MPKNPAKKAPRRDSARQSRDRYAEVRSTESDAIRLLAGESFDDILRPILEDVRKRGITEDQLDQMVARARKAM